MRIPYFARLAVLSSIAAVACTDPAANGSCPDIFTPALAVYVRDSVSDAGIAVGATLVATDGAYRDSVTVPDDAPSRNTIPVLLASDRPGTYSLAVRKPGYLPHLYSGLRVTAKTCGVNTVTVNARLQPAP